MYFPATIKGAFTFNDAIILGYNTTTVKWIYEQFSEQNYFFNFSCQDK